MPRPKLFTDEELRERKRAQDRAYNAAHREQQKAWREANKEHLREQGAEYRKANKERIAAWQAEYRKKNAERIRLARKARPYVRSKESMERKAARLRETRYFERYRAQNRARIAAQQHNYRARKRAAQGRLSKDIVQRLMKLQRARCAGCGASLRARGHHLDHAVPLAKGGSNSDDNVQLLCPRCNCGKRHADPIAWAQRNGRLL